MIKNDASLSNERENEKDVIFGRNSVAEAIKSGRPLDSVMVARGDRVALFPK
jgi:tRNA G18 (ribose-2'-O)-methylase SpoU